MEISGATYLVGGRPNFFTREDFTGSPIITLTAPDLRDQTRAGSKIKMDSNFLNARIWMGLNF